MRDPDRVFVLQLDGDLTLSGDRVRLAQVLANFLEDAVQHGDRQTAVSLTAAGEEHAPVCTVVVRRRGHCFFDSPAALPLISVVARVVAVRILAAATVIGVIAVLRSISQGRREEGSQAPACIKADHPPGCAEAVWAVHDGLPMGLIVGANYH